MMCAGEQATSYLASDSGLWMSLSDSVHSNIIGPLLFILLPNLIYELPRIPTSWYIGRGRMFGQAFIESRTAVNLGTKVSLTIPERRGYFSLSVLLFRTRHEQHVASARLGAASVYVCLVASGAQQRRRERESRARCRRPRCS
jgi:hypothetical protein